MHCGFTFAISHDNNYEVWADEEIKQGIPSYYIINQNIEGELNATFQLCRYEGHIYVMLTGVQDEPASKSLKKREMKEYTERIMASRGYCKDSFTIILPPKKYPIGETAIAYMADVIGALLYKKQKMCLSF